jgi:hypothetical protein
MHGCFRIRLLAAAFFLIGVNAWSAGSVFNITDYGAKNDGSASASGAFRSAIQAAKAAGGGTVHVPPGKYNTGPIQMISNLTLNIDAGATLNFVADRAELPFTKGRLEGVERITPIPLIGGSNLENVAITGRGTITTNYPDWRNMIASQTEARALGQSLLQRLNLKQPVPEADFQKAAMALRPSFIRFFEGKNILIQGIHIVGSSMWVIHMVYSEKIVIRDVIVESFGVGNGDGVDIDSSRDVLISDSYFDTGDDGICLKSGKDADGLRVNRPTENVTITNIVVHRAHGAVVLGSETSGGIRNVVASNIVCKGTEKGVRLKSTRGRGGVLENLRFDNWTMEGVGEGIHVTNYYTKTAEEPVSERTPIFHNVAISNMTIKDSHTVINIEGLPEMPVNGLRISDVIGSGKLGMKAYNTLALELHNVQLNAETGPAFLIKDSKDLELDGVTTRKPLAGVPVIRLDNSPGAIIRASKAFGGTDTFLSAGPSEIKNITLIGNALGAAKKATEEGTQGPDFWKAAAPAPSAGSGRGGRGGIPPPRTN